MKRSVLVLFLLLASLTLAPRTAFAPEEPDEGQVLVQARLPEHQVPVGSTVSLIFRVTNAGPDFEPEFYLETDTGLSRIVSASPGCKIAQDVVTCEELTAGERRIIRATVRVLDTTEHVVSFKRPSVAVGSFLPVARGSTSARR